MSSSTVVAVEERDHEIKKRIFHFCFWKHASKKIRLFKFLIFEKIRNCPGSQDRATLNPTIIVEKERAVCGAHEIRNSASGRFFGFFTSRPVLVGSQWGRTGRRRRRRMYKPCVPSATADTPTRNKAGYHIISNTPGDKQVRTR